MAPRMLAVRPVGDATHRRVTIIGLNYAPEPTGIAPYTTALARGLAQDGYCVKVITGYPHYPQWRIFEGFTGRSQRQTTDGVDVLRLRHYVPRHPSFVPRTAMELIFGLRAVASRWSRPDVVVVVSPALFSSLLAMVRAKLTGVPVISWIQDIYTVGVGEAGASRHLASVVRVPESLLVRGSSRVVAIHERFRRALVARLGARSRRIDVIRNWSHVAPASTGRDEATRALHGWSPDDVVVLHAGNMGAKQGLENVVAASELASKKGSRLRFVLLGDGNRRSALEAMSSNPNLQFIDPLPDGMFERTLASADVLLVNERPGLSDMSVPSKLTSYFTTGLPVVGAVDSGSITAEELAAVGCPRVDPDDPGALVAAVEQLVDDPDMAAEIGARGREFCRTELTGEAAMSAFERTLRAALGMGWKAQDTSTLEKSTPGTATD